MIIILMINDWFCFFILVYKEKINMVVFYCLYHMYLYTFLNSQIMIQTYANLLSLIFKDEIKWSLREVFSRATNSWRQCIQNWRANHHRLLSSPDSPRSLIGGSINTFLFYWRFLCGSRVKCDLLLGTKFWRALFAVFSIKC